MQDGRTHTRREAEPRDAPHPSAVEGRPVSPSPAPLQEPPQHRWPVHPAAPRPLHLRRLYAVRVSHLAGSNVVAGGNDAYLYVRFRLGGREHATPFATVASAPTGDSGSPVFCSAAPAPVWPRLGQSAFFYWDGRGAMPDAELLVCARAAAAVEAQRRLLQARAAELATLLYDADGDVEDSSSDSNAGASGGSDEGSDSLEAGRGVTSQPPRPLRDGEEVTWPLSRTERRRHRRQQQRRNESSTRRPLSPHASLSRDRRGSRHSARRHAGDEAGEDPVAQEPVHPAEGDRVVGYARVRLDPSMLDSGSRLLVRPPRPAAAAPHSTVSAPLPSGAAVSVGDATGSLGRAPRRGGGSPAPRAIGGDDVAATVSATTTTTTVRLGIRGAQDAVLLHRNGTLGCLHFTLSAVPASSERRVAGAADGGRGRGATEEEGEDEDEEVLLVRRVTGGAATVEAYVDAEEARLRATLDRVTAHHALSRTLQRLLGAPAADGDALISAQRYPAIGGVAGAIPSGGSADGGEAVGAGERPHGAAVDECEHATASALPCTAATGCTIVQATFHPLDPVLNLSDVRSYLEAQKERELVQAVRRLEVLRRVRQLHPDSRAQWWTVRRRRIVRDARRRSSTTRSTVGGVGVAAASPEPVLAVDTLLGNRGGRLGRLLWATHTAVALCVQTTSPRRAWPCTHFVRSIRGVDPAQAVLWRAQQLRKTAYTASLAAWVRGLRSADASGAAGDAQASEAHDRHHAALAQSWPSLATSSSLDGAAATESSTASEVSSTGGGSDDGRGAAAEAAPPPVPVSATTSADPPDALAQTLHAPPRRRRTHRSSRSRGSRDSSGGGRCGSSARVADLPQAPADANGYHWERLAIRVTEAAELLSLRLTVLVSVPPMTGPRSMAALTAPAACPATPSTSESQSTSTHLPTLLSAAATSPPSCVTPPLSTYAQYPTEELCTIPVDGPALMAQLALWEARLAAQPHERLGTVPVEAALVPVFLPCYAPSPDVGAADTASHQRDGVCGWLRLVLRLSPSFSVAQLRDALQQQQQQLQQLHRSDGRAGVALVSPGTATMRPDAVLSVKALSSGPPPASVTALLPPPLRCSDTGSVLAPPPRGGPLPEPPLPDAPAAAAAAAAASAGGAAVTSVSRSGCVQAPPPLVEDTDWYRLSSTADTAVPLLANSLSSHTAAPGAAAAARGGRLRGDAAVPRGHLYVAPALPSDGGAAQGAPSASGTVPVAAAPTPGTHTTPPHTVAGSAAASGVVGARDSWETLPVPPVAGFAVRVEDASTSVVPRLAGTAEAPTGLVAGRVYCAVLSFAALSHSSSTSAAAVLCRLCSEPAALLPTQRSSSKRTTAAASSATVAAWRDSTYVVEACGPHLGIPLRVDLMELPAASAERISSSTAAEGGGAAAAAAAAAALVLHRSPARPDTPRWVGAVVLRYGALPLFGRHHFSVARPPDGDPAPLASSSGRASAARHGGPASGAATTLTLSWTISPELQQLCLWRRLQRLQRESLLTFAVSAEGVAWVYERVRRAGASRSTTRRHSSCATLPDGCDGGEEGEVDASGPHVDVLASVAAAAAAGRDTALPPRTRLPGQERHVYVNAEEPRRSAQRPSARGPVTASGDSEKRWWPPRLPPYAASCDHQRMHGVGSELAAASLRSRPSPPPRVQCEETAAETDIGFDEAWWEGREARGTTCTHPRPPYRPSAASSSGRRRRRSGTRAHRHRHAASCGDQQCGHTGRAEHKTAAALEERGTRDGIVREDRWPSPSPPWQSASALSVPPRLLLRVTVLSAQNLRLPHGGEAAAAALAPYVVVRYQDAAYDNFSLSLPSIAVAGGGGGGGSALFSFSSLFDVPRRLAAQSVHVVTVEVRDALSRRLFGLAHVPVRLPLSAAEGDASAALFDGARVHGRRRTGPPSSDLRLDSQAELQSWHSGSSTGGASLSPAVLGETATHVVPVCRPLSMAQPTERTLSSGSALGQLFSVDAVARASSQGSGGGGCCVVGELTVLAQVLPRPTLDGTLAAQPLRLRLTALGARALPLAQRWRTETGRHRRPPTDAPDTYVVVTVRQHTDLAQAGVRRYSMSAGGGHDGSVGSVDSSGLSGVWGSSDDGDAGHPRGAETCGSTREFRSATVRGRRQPLWYLELPPLLCASPADEYSFAVYSADEDGFDVCVGECCVTARALLERGRPADLCSSSGGAGLASGSLSAVPQTLHLPLQQRRSFSDRDGSGGGGGALGAVVVEWCFAPAAVAADSPAASERAPLRHRRPTPRAAPWCAIVLELQLHEVSALALELPSSWAAEMATAAATAPVFPWSVVAAISIDDGALGCSTPPTTLWGEPTAAEAMPRGEGREGERGGAADLVCGAGGTASPWPGLIHGRLKPETAVTAHRHVSTGPLEQRWYDAAGSRDAPLSASSSSSSAAVRSLDYVAMDAAFPATVLTLPLRLSGGAPVVRVHLWLRERQCVDATPPLRPLPLRSGDAFLGEALLHLDSLPVCSAPLQEPAPVTLLLRPRRDPRHRARDVTRANTFARGLGTLTLHAGVYSVAAHSARQRHLAQQRGWRAELSVAVEDATDFEADGVYAVEVRCVGTSVSKRSHIVRDRNPRFHTSFTFDVFTATEMVEVKLLEWWESHSAPRVTAVATFAVQVDGAAAAGPCTDRASVHTVWLQLLPTAETAHRSARAAGCSDCPPATLAACGVAPKLLLRWRARAPAPPTADGVSPTCTQTSPLVDGAAGGAGEQAHDNGRCASRVSAGRGAGAREGHAAVATSVGTQVTTGRRAERCGDDSDGDAAQEPRMADGVTAARLRAGASAAAVDGGCGLHCDAAPLPPYTSGATAAPGADPFVLNVLWLTGEIVSFLGTGSSTAEDVLAYCCAVQSGGTRGVQRVVQEGVQAREADARRSRPGTVSGVDAELALAPLVLRPKVGDGGEDETEAELLPPRRPLSTIARNGDYVRVVHTSTTTRGGDTLCDDGAAEDCATREAQQHADFANNGLSTRLWPASPPAVWERPQRPAALAVDGDPPSTQLLTLAPLAGAALQLSRHCAVPVQQPQRLYWLTSRRVLAKVNAALRDRYAVYAQDALLSAPGPHTHTAAETGRGDVACDGVSPAAAAAGETRASRDASLGGGRPCVVEGKDVEVEVRCLAITVLYGGVGDPLTQEIVRWAGAHGQSVRGFCRPVQAAVPSSFHVRERVFGASELVGDREEHTAHTAAAAHSPWVEAAEVCLQGTPCSLYALLCRLDRLTGCCGAVGGGDAPVRHDEPAPPLPPLVLTEEVVGHVPVMRRGLVHVAANAWEARQVWRRCGVACQDDAATAHRGRSGCAGLRSRERGGEPLDPLFIFRVFGAPMDGEAHPRLPHGGIGVYRMDERALPQL
ncbi:C2 domain containing protein [Novymonas esmeraldas]|uniref:C2 domain containing protein n=1 Tax=Novymonas esmeraldas TaxID=1808958 RepID=A0AAW0F0E4_9TRYP